MEKQLVKQSKLINVLLLEQGRKTKAPVTLAIMEWTLDTHQETEQLIETTFSLSWILICFCPLISRNELKPAWLLTQLFWIPVCHLFLQA